MRKCKYWVNKIGLFAVKYKEEEAVREVQCQKIIRWLSNKGKCATHTSMYTFIYRYHLNM